MIKRLLTATALSAALLSGSVIADDGMWNQIKGNWGQMSGKVKENWADMTDDEIGQLDGSREQLVGVVQEKYGIAQQEAEQQVDKWAEALGMDK